MPTFEQIVAKGISLSKQLAMGVEATEPEGYGIPEGKRGLTSPKLSRSEGRAADAKESGMPKCDPESGPFWDGGHDAQPDESKVKVSAHTRSRPGGLVGPS